MRRSFLTLIVGLAVVAAACTSTPSGSGTDEAPQGDPAPTASFVMFDGSTATLADYQGRPVVVNFWASWCPSCVAEMSAAFKPAQEQLGDQVAFLGMNLQDDRERALSLVEETGVLFDLGEDQTGELYLEFGGIGMPFTAFIDAEGNVVKDHNGPLSEQQLVELIQETLLP
ncbi:MAG: hypothetical protein BMS9Abin07_0420 [Acidimicrobiia bacterium]|nr:MAG: hypothetical protein BMS9Abin07_0420 [Acidimicrobiia bacterium]